MQLGTFKAAHTVNWGSDLMIGAIWLSTIQANVNGATLAIMIGLTEIVVVRFSRGQCPLDRVAARHARDLNANFDMFLPAWPAAVPWATTSAKASR